MTDSCHLSPSQSTYTYENEVHGSLSTIDHFLGTLHMLSSISKCVVAEEDPTNTSDHLPILPRMELYLQSQGTTNSEIPPNIPHSKLNCMGDVWYTLPMELQLSKVGCPTLKQFLHNPASSPL